MQLLSLPKILTLPPTPPLRSEALEARLQHWTNSDRDVAEAAEAESSRVAQALAAACAELATLQEEHRLLRDSGEAMMEAKDAEVGGREGGSEGRREGGRRPRRWGGRAVTRPDKGVAEEESPPKSFP